MKKETIHAIFENVAGASPENIAVSDGFRSITYRELNKHANKIGYALISNGLAREGIVGVYLDASIQYVASVLGILKAGGIFLPLGTKYPEKRLQAILGKANPKGVITDAVGEKIISDTNIIPINIERVVATEESPETRETTVSPDDDAYIITTSGSTGEPKLILGTHRGVTHFINWEINRFGINREVRVSLLAPPTFDVSLRDIFVPLAAGGTLCIPDEETRHNPRELLAWLRDEQISLMHIVPSMFRRLTRVIKESGIDTLPQLQRVLIAGEPLYGSDVNNWYDLVGNRVKLVNLYGPSETTLAKTFYEIENKSYTPGEIIPLGKPLPDTDILIIRDDKLCREGEVGEIHIRTPFKTRGYYKSPRLNEESFVANPSGSNPDDIVYRTGDLGKYLPDGNISFEGRYDGQLKLYGNRVESGEIEVVLRQHPQVEDVAVDARPDVFGNPRLIAYIVPRGEVKPTVEALRRFAAEYLTDYMIPAVFITLDSLPFTHSGKIDRGALPNPAGVRPEMEQVYMPPSTKLEKDLTGIWQQVLNLERVGIEDNFFALGGTSLLAINMVTQVKKDLGIELPVIILFQYPTISQLVEYMARNRDKEALSQEIFDRAERRKAALERRRRTGTRRSR